MPKPTLHEIVKINAQYILLKCDVYIMYWIVDVLFCTIFLCIRTQYSLSIQTTSANSYKRVVNGFSVLLCSEILWVAHPVHINH